MLMLDGDQMHVASVTIPVLEIDLAGAGFQVLIGRDILRKYVMLYDGPNESLMLFV